jgi:DNA-binding transcriptional ArsR family regulator
MIVDIRKTMDVFTALADPTRRRMLELLAGSAKPAGAFAEAFPDVRQPTLSHHLKVLREAGLVQVEADAQRRIYSLRTEPLQEIGDWLAHNRLYWRNELDALEDHLDTMPLAEEPPDER